MHYYYQKIPALFLILFCQLALTGYAQDAGKYPNKSITFIASSAPGGTTDFTARVLAQPLGLALGQTIVVENKAGASGAIAAAAVKKSDPDGYTLLVQYSGYHVITPLVSKNPLPWELKDFQPVANVISAPQIVVIRADLPFKTMAELVSYAKANPGKLNYASSGNGSLQHVTGAMLEQQAGIKMTHVPYKGTGPALADLLGGQVDLTFGTPPPFIPHIQTGKLLALATTGKKRIPSLPDVPTAAEAGLPKLDATSWFAVFAPSNTPALIVNRLTTEIAKVMAVPAFKEKVIEMGAEATYLNPKQLGEFIKSENIRWTSVVKTAKIEAD
ncbi:tripartite tricarboxylate transporter substrate binding protein [Polynucleobacter sp. CS-Odin-A6]|uniref:Bug family tripartite tricarboxylate transporter substrate binding protein n=1 Tax=Polynucleobacter sp. CS-Odin-A6 TaxID=2689106 RepID=UPI001C0C5034|nr:tripartite tricarboxylate transporter substrate binding protein [Polynucleobacter sp. CS-Odin-A6]MBU3620461.1 tripartite tricarboxylate transporter substrate binding protein [Polynucleobacter sp. CS-Odin-A6]